MIHLQRLQPGTCSGANGYRMPAARLQVEVCPNGVSALITAASMMCTPAAAYAQVAEL